ncbi:peptidoglycan-binding protein [Streptomyces sp. NBC_00199]|uniref:peptidoglycan-binding protein n=1 Tax=Streptomyces sp. NBC_00199 TaxID=2975678 RepID=UPI00224DF731|nr:peptidoglycan-binding protein [Streptomyces sp. NBC_00199]MCX5266096.1 peptidoglycan-binding protein [Streptomyces sp. NBC_00199]
MSVSIVSRATWGATPWAGTPDTIALSQRTEFFVHYDGAAHINRTGYAVMRAIEAEHLGNGWSGVGYNFVVDQAGTIFEGRGWTLQGAHCPGHNVTGIGVQIAIGGDQEPSAKALAAARALYDEACRRTGRTLAKRGHRDGYATLCPGSKLYKWVQAGMPAQGYEPTTPDGPSSPSTGGTVARYQVTINGLIYGYGAKGDHVTALGRALVARGFGKHYSSGPGPVWTDADTLNFSDYQRSLGCEGTAPHEDADGVPGETSLRRLLGTLPGPAKPAPTAPAFPGRDKFGAGANNAYVTQLGRQLVKKGFGTHYTSGPGPRWSEADRQNVAAFQRSQGWTGAEADGYPGPETWRRLFA